MPPRVSKSRIGHLSSLLRSGVQTFSYRNNVTQLLGVKGATSVDLDRQKKLNAGESSLRYLDVASADSPTMSIHKTDDTEPTNQQKLSPDGIKKTNSNDDVNLPETDVIPRITDNQSVPPGKFEQPANSNFGKSAALVKAEVIKAEELVMNLTDNQSQYFKKNDIGSAVLTKATSFVDGVKTEALVSQELTSLGKNTSLGALESMKSNDDVSNSFKGINSSKYTSAQPKDSNQLFHDLKKTKTKTNIKQDINPEKKSVDPSEKAQPDQQKIDSRNRVFSNHQQLVKRYQRLMEKGANPNFRVNEKTRSAMNEMQGNLAVSDVKIAPDHKSTTNLVDAKKKGTNSTETIHKNKSQAIRSLKSIRENTQRLLPNKNENRNSTSGNAGDKNNWNRLEQKLENLKEQIQDLRQLNRRQQQKLARIESREQTYGQGQSRSRRSSISDSFWERNRLTHALLRMRK